MENSSPKVLVQDTDRECKCKVLFSIHHTAKSGEQNEHTILSPTKVPQILFYQVSIVSFWDK